MPEAAPIIEMANAFWASQVLFASSDLGIFAFLPRGAGVLRPLRG